MRKAYVADLGNLAGEAAVQPCVQTVAHFWIAALKIDAGLSVLVVPNDEPCGVNHGLVRQENIHIQHLGGLQGNRAGHGDSIAAEIDSGALKALPGAYDFESNLQIRGASKMLSVAAQHKVVSGIESPAKRQRFDRSAQQKVGPAL